MHKPFYLKPFLLGVALAAAWTPGLIQAAGFNYWNLCDTCTAAPSLLSATGILSNFAVNKKLIPSAIHYEVNVPSWNDGAKKTTWVILPNNKSIDYSDTGDYFGYPDSTVFIQQFTFDTIPGVASSRVLWETRLLINKKDAYDSTFKMAPDRWYGFSYKWNADQTDAVLQTTKYYGVKDSLRIWPMGTTNPSRFKKWVFPSANTCIQCHRSQMGFTVPPLHARSVLGFFPAQLNRPAPDSAGVNQLEYLFAKKVLKGTKPASWAASPRWYPIEDASAPIDSRAHAYIASNCSGCHGERGNGVAAASMCILYLDYYTGKEQKDIRHFQVGGRGTEDTLPKYYAKNGDGNNPTHLDSLKIMPALVVPGYPQKSLVLFRQLKKLNEFAGNYDQMPPASTYSTFEVDAVAMDTLKKWITNITPLAAPIGIRAVFHNTHSDPEAFLQGRRLLISKAGAKLNVSMSSVNGRQVPLLKINDGEYTIPAEVPKGLYMVQIGSVSLLRYLF